MDVLKKVSDAAPALKIFPLPPVVLFPGTGVPLHIFEPRYRQLITDALATDRVMALGGLAPGWEEAYTDRPALLPIACAGVIGEHESLPDGRFMIVLEGVTRVRVRSELPSRRLYREVAVEILEDAPFKGDEEEALRQAVLELASLLPEEVTPPLLHHAALQSGGLLADVVAGAVVAEPHRRQDLLAELEVGARLRAVHAEVSELIAKLAAMRPALYLN